MNRSIIAFLIICVTLSAHAQPVDRRVVHNDPATYRSLTSVHVGAGSMGFTQLIGRDDLNANFLYLHAGTIEGKSGIGHHFHHSIEEMYVLLSGEAEFTINGRTSTLTAPVVVPCKLGDSHAIYNKSTEPVKWLNFAVSNVKGRGDAFDLGDDRVGASPDPVPVFVSGQLDKSRLSAERHPFAGNGLLYTRVLGPEIFRTNWDHVDYLVIPAGKATQTIRVASVEEVVYVIAGKGNLEVNGETMSLGRDDAFSVLTGDNYSLANNGKEQLELLMIGIAIGDKQAKNTSPDQKTAIALQMDFVVPEKNRTAFEEMYSSIYVPAMVVQKGYLESKLLRLFPETVGNEIDAEPTPYNYSIQIYFDTEQSRRNWVASDQHKIAWPAAEKLATKYRWRGYDVIGEDSRK